MTKKSKYERYLTQYKSALKAGGLLGGLASLAQIYSYASPQLHTYLAKKDTSSQYSLRSDFVRIGSDMKRGIRREAEREKAAD